MTHGDAAKPDSLEAPLESLYGPGTGLASVERTNRRFEPLLLAIESAIVEYCDATRPPPLGGSVGLTIKQLGMNHEAPTADPLARAVLMAVRFCLAKNDYSRQDVKGALRAVAKSVERHTRESGPHGYLTFVRPFVKSRRY